MLRDPGVGDGGAGVRLARTLAERDESEVRTVAYVPRRAAGVAVLIVELTGGDETEPEVGLEIRPGGMSVVGRF